MSECLKSAIGQTWKQHEVIVVDDGSTDESLRIAESYSGHEGVFVIRQQQRGACAARNAGFVKSRGEFVQFLDADDVLAPDKVEQQLRILLSADQQTICSCAWGHFRDDIRTARFEPNAVWQDLAPREWLRASLANGFIMQTAVWLGRRSLLERAGKWNESLLVNQDGEYFARVLTGCRLIRFCPEAKVYYRANVPGSISIRNSEAKQRSDFDAITLIETTALTFDDSPEMRRTIASIYQSWIHHVYPDLPDLRRGAERKVRELGGASPRIGGTVGFQILRRFVGWKIARRIERTALRAGLSRAAIKAGLRKRSARVNY